MEDQTKLQALRIQIDLAQAIIVMMQEKYGSATTIEMLNELITGGELEPSQATLLHNLVTGMQAEAMGSAGKALH